MQVVSPPLTMSKPSWDNLPYSDNKAIIFNFSYDACVKAPELLRRPFPFWLVKNHPASDAFGLTHAFSFGKFLSIMQTSSWKNLSALHQTLQ